MKCARKLPRALSFPPFPIKNAQIRADGAKALARGLAANATLAALSLAWNGLESSGGGAFGDALALNVGLRRLDLSNCRLGPDACLMLANGLRVRNAGLVGFARSHIYMPPVQTRALCPIT